MLRPVRTVGPAAVLLTTAEAKAQCRVDSADDDTLIDALVQAATDKFDGWAGILGRCLVNQTWRQDFEDWSDDLRLPFPDAQSSGLTVKYSDTANADQTVSSSLYELLEDGAGSFIRFRSAFTSPSLYTDRSDPVRVTFVAGYGAAASAVPQAIRHAALMLVGHWYENREAAGDSKQELPMGVDSLIAPYRRRQN